MEYGFDVPRTDIDLSVQDDEHGHRPFLNIELERVHTQFLRF